MTTRTRLTPKTLAAEARRLSGDIDAARWVLAELAARAKTEGVEGWAEIIGVECRREPRTVRAWAVTWEWCYLTGQRKHEFPGGLTYSFFETAARYSDRVEIGAIAELLAAYLEDRGRTLESFRAELATLAGNDDAADFRHWADKERTRILGWIDRAPGGTKGHSADCLRLAADALADALEKETA